jgi:hypothetical protein
MTLFTDDSTSLDDMIFPVFRAKAPGHLILLGFGVGVSNVILHTLHTLTFSLVLFLALMSPALVRASYDLGVECPDPF